MTTTNLINRPTVGSLFAGIGGFDLGFENAGFVTKWQVEINPIPRAVLSDRFPHAQRFEDVRTVGKHNLSPVDCIVGGFPCQDVSAMGKRAGLAGSRTGLFWEVIRILQELRPQWVVLENVVGLLHSNAGKDFETVLQALAQSGYLGLWRVLNSSGFGVPQMRRRVYLVAGLGIPPPLSCWLTPAQWSNYLQRVNRQKPTFDRMASRPILYLPKTPQTSWVSITKISSLTKTDGIRCLSGPEALKIQGFASDWMRSTMLNIGLQVTPSRRKSHNGSLKS